VFLVFYYNFVKRGPFATKFVHSVTDNVNKFHKFGYCVLSTFSCVHVLRLNRMSVRTDLRTAAVCPYFKNTDGPYRYTASGPFVSSDHGQFHFCHPDCIIYCH